MSVGGNPGECGAIIAFGGYDGRRYQLHARDASAGRARMDTRGEKPREAFMKSVTRRGTRHGRWRPRCRRGDVEVK